MTEPLARWRPLPRGPETWACLLVARRDPRTGRPGGPSYVSFPSSLTAGPCGLPTSSVSPGVGIGPAAACPAS